MYKQNKLGLVFIVAQIVAIRCRKRFKTSCAVWFCSSP